MSRPRILVINPNRSVSMTRAIDSVARAAAPETEVMTLCVSYGPESIESEADAALAAVAVLECILEHPAYDGYVIACFDDPGLEAARELTTQPVVGIAESAARAAAAYTPEDVGVLVVREGVVHRVRDTLARYACGSQAKYHSLDGSVASLARGDDATAQQFEDAARAAAEAGARAAVLACAGFGQYARRIAESSGLEVIDGVVEGVRHATALIREGHQNHPITPMPFSGIRSHRPVWADKADRKATLP
ncbi:aspartate/glutamate racemase family protein [Gulosibacter sp. ACHW.36C]|uniref:Aspartate/glutamate racemase family protein n=1 Tax=Gulosibacter sediminis TaxID=1729695 RepID=A0ABY4MX85_9MICO|nr:aspartate/glutamate racemase family protein [Gulosibacter sediminis]UQN14659.1 aspartate/glutamate racemase family protein [Gulosibacter sediminis]